MWAEMTKPFFSVVDIVIILAVTDVLVAISRKLLRAISNRRA
jgi:hypothetical protein